MSRNLSFAAALILTPLAALAGRPMATEDAGVLERGACELESFLADARARGTPTTTAYAVQVGCGIGASSQLALALSEAKAGGARDRATTLLGKTALNDPSLNPTALTLAWGIAWTRPDGGTSERDVAFLNGVVTHPLSDTLKLHGNLGWSHSRLADATTTNWNLGLEKSYGQGFDAMAEIFGTDRESSPWVQVALRWAVKPDTFYIDGSWGMQTSSSRPKLFTVGLKYAF